MPAAPRSVRPTPPRIFEHVRRELARRRGAASPPAAPATSTAPAVLAARQASTNEKRPAQG